MKLNIEKVKSLRAEKGFTQEYIAITVGYTNKSAYCQLESGKRQPSISKLGRLSKIFGVSTDELLQEDE